MDSKLAYRRLNLIEKGQAPQQGLPALIHVNDRL